MAPPALTTHSGQGGHISPGADRDDPPADCARVRHMRAQTDYTGHYTVWAVSPIRQSGTVHSYQTTTGIRSMTGEVVGADPAASRLQSAATLRSSDARRESNIATTRCYCSIAIATTLGHRPAHPRPRANHALVQNHHYRRVTTVSHASATQRRAIDSGAAPPDLAHHATRSILQ